MTTRTLVLLLQVALSLPTDAINTICPNNQHMDDIFRNISLEAHNFRRMQLAKGAVSNEKGINLPPASNMRKLKYDCNLERSAVAAAAAICSSGAQRNLPPDMQENARTLPKNTAQKREDAVVKAIDVWWSQIKDSGGIGQSVTYTSMNVNTPTAWFVRMAWANTQSLGCAVVECATPVSVSWTAVCHYKPGAIVNQRIYEIGALCSACPSGTPCENGLCAG